MSRVRELVWTERMNPLISTERLEQDFVIAESSEDGRIVGCGGLRRSISHAIVEVSSLVVAPDQRGRGIGSSLLAQLVEDAAERDVPPPYTRPRAAALLTLSSTQSFYARHGFQLADIMRTETPLPPSLYAEFLAGQLVARIIAGDALVLMTRAL